MNIFKRFIKRAREQYEHPRAIIVKKTRFEQDGTATTVFYLCGPQRTSYVAAQEDLEMFVRAQRHP